MTATAAPAQTMRLTTLGLDIPAAPFTLGTSKTWQGREGQGCEINVMQGRTVIGTLTDQGNGGGPRFDGHTRDANIAWNDYVAQFDGLTFDIYGDPYGLGVLLIGSYRDTGKGNPEDVATLLIQNALLLKTLKTRSRTKTVFLLDSEFVTSGFRLLSGGPDSPESRAFLTSRYPGKTIRVWNPTSTTWDTL